MYTDVAMVDWYLRDSMSAASVGLLMNPPSMRMAGWRIFERTLKRALLIPLSGTAYLAVISFIWP